MSSEAHDVIIENCIKKLDHFDAVIREAEAGYALSLLELRKNCDHEILLEAPYQALEYFGDMPELRICETCGLEEAGRSHKYLKGRAYPAKRDGPDGVYSRRRRGPRTMAKDFYEENPTNLAI